MNENLEKIYNEYCNIITRYGYFEQNQILPLEKFKEIYTDKRLNDYEAYIDFVNGYGKSVTNQFKRFDEDFYEDFVYDSSVIE